MLSLVDAHPYHAALRPASPARAAPRAQDLAAIFNRIFAGAPYFTEVCIGADEPIYRPRLPQTAGGRAQIFSRADFPRSVLHEVSHWCLAGSQRRAQEDYGYWYKPDGRAPLDQEKFEQVEARPQALEWLFCLACGLEFRVSCDNLAGVCPPIENFCRKVWEEFCVFSHRGAPTRARHYLSALKDHFASADAFTRDCADIISTKQWPAA